MSAYMALPRKEKISPFDTCPLASWQIDSTRQAIHQINDDLELWDGIYKCVTSGGTWRDYSDYQVAWNHAILWGDAPQNVWVGSRFSAKTQTTIEGIVRLMALKPRTLVSFIPGGNMRQNAEPSRYFNTIVNNSPILSAEKGEPWQETTKTFLNGSRLMFLPPTIDGVQSMRGNVQIFDEAQKLDHDVQIAALPQGGVKGTKRFYTGIALSDTILDTQYHSPSTKFRIITPVQEVIRAGIVDEQAIINSACDENFSEDEFRWTYLCDWVRASDRVFQPQIITELPPDMNEGRLTRKVLGIDFNPVKSHWGVLAAQDINGNIVCLKEYGTKLYEGILEMGGDAEIRAEDGGTNTGYCEALQNVNNKRMEKRSIVREAWTEEMKGRQVANVIRLQEEKKWYIYKKGCPILARDVGSIPFNEKGVPDKAKAEKNSKNAHVVDAMIHAVNGAAEESATAYILSVWNS
jgi:hypothetical protein